MPLKAVWFQASKAAIDLRRKRSIRRRNKKGGPSDEAGSAQHGGEKAVVNPPTSKG